MLIPVLSNIKTLFECSHVLLLFLCKIILFDTQIQIPFRGGKCMNFGERLKQLIEENNLTQRQLSRELNIAPTTLSGYANGYREPDFFTLTKFADYFNVSVDYLIGYSDNPYHTRTSRDQSAERLLYYYEKLSPDIRELLLDEARLLLKYNHLNTKNT